MAKTTSIDPARLREIAARIRPVNEVTPYVKIGVYGRNGSGKTRFAASAPNCLILDVNEEGTRSARNTNAHVIEVSRWEEVGYVSWLLRSAKRLRGGGIAVPMGKDGKKVRVQSFAVDTITSMNHAAMRFVLGEQDDRDPTRERQMPDKRSYGRAGELVKDQLLTFRALPLHVIFLAQMRTITDEDTGEVVLHTMDLPGGSRGVALGSVGIVGHIYPQKVTKRVNGKKRSQWEDRLRVGPSEDHDTKDRTFALGDVVRSPNMTDVIKAWRANPPQAEDEEE